MEITPENFLGRGGTKAVYSHPYDSDLCIKFPRKDKKRALNGLKREIRYLKKYQDHLAWLAPYMGTIETNLGLGYTYKRIRNADGTPSEMILKSDYENHVGALKDKIRLMYKQLIKHHAVVNDLSLNNIFFRKKDGDDFDVILIDGFGNNNFIKIADYSKYFLINKLNRKFNRLCANLNIPFDFCVQKIQRKAQA